MNSAVKSLHALQILDSRGNPTISVRMILEDGSVGFASIPSGASPGEYEAVELRDGDACVYRGKGMSKAISFVSGLISEALIGVDARDQAAVDKTLLQLDGTSNKQYLGANTILGVSFAAAKAAACSCDVELFEYLGGSKTRVLPVPLVNAISGGAHAENSLDIQGFMIVPHGASSFAEAVRMSAETFHALGRLLRDDGYNTGVGDEGGYAPRLESMDLALEFLLRAIERAGYKPAEDLSLALNIGASELVEEASGSANYLFAKSCAPSRTSSEMVDMYEDWLDRYPIVSIEDGLGENDLEGWQEMTNRLGKRVQLVGDDIFVTNAERISLYSSQGIANAVLIKPNQIGTLSETMSAIEVANSLGYPVIVADRSGETEDSFIADLAVAVNAGQIRAGSMCRGERIAKYNRLLWIEDKLGTKGEYKSPF